MSPCTSFLGWPQQIVITWWLKMTGTSSPAVWKAGGGRSVCWRLSAGPAGGSSAPHAAVFVSGGRRPRLVSPPDLHPSRPWLRAAGVTGDGPRPRAGPAGGGWPLSLSSTRGGVTEEGSPFPRPVTALLRPAGGTGEPGSRRSLLATTPTLRGGPS